MKISRKFVENYQPKKIKIIIKKTTKQTNSQQKIKNKIIIIPFDQKKSRDELGRLST